MKNYWLFVRQNWALLCFGFVCVFWGNFGQSFFLGWYGEAIKTSLDLSAQAYGATYSLATLCSGFTIMWVGAWIDRWRLRSFLIFVACGLLLACLLLAQASNVVVLCLGFYLVRLFGQGLFPHTGVTTMARHFESNRGKAISLATTGVPVGEVVLPILAVALMAHLGWQHSWWVIAASIPMILLPLSFYLLRCANWQDAPAMAPGAAVKEQVANKASPKEEGAALAKSQSGRKQVLSDKRFWLAAPTLLSAPFMLTAIFIHQDFVMSQKQWPASLIASGFVIYGVVHWLSSISFGVLVDRFSATQLFRFYALPIVLALLLVANIHGQWVALVMMAMLGITNGASGPVAGSLWAEVYGKEVVGAVRSAVGSIMVLSTSISPYVFGLMIDADWSLPLIFNGFALFFIASYSLLYFSYRKNLH